MRSEWNFDTVKSISAMGTFRGSAKDLLMPPGMIMEEADEYADDESTIDTGAATKGSDPLLSNSEASHSTVIIKAPLPPPIELDDDDAPTGRYIYFLQSPR
jgi:serine/threonine-protein kinase 24/25/MST4